MRTPVFSMARLALGLALSCLVAFGQSSPTPPSPPPSAPPGGGTSPGTPRTPSPNIPQPTDNRQQNPQLPVTRTTILLSGKVMLDDGTPPPDSVVIQRVCGMTVRPEAYTDSKGHFSFDMGRNFNVLPDASTGSLTSIDDPMNQQTGTGTRSPFGRAESTRSLMGCELRASLAGYRSDVIDLSGRRPMENPDVGVIVLHRLAKVEGTTISAISLRAPKDAKKSYEKGAQARKKKKWEEAQAHLEKAVAIYPEYAAAWFELGLAHAGQNNLESARKAYGRALAADAKFLKPYMELATISMTEKKWDEVVATTSQLIKLDPIDFAGAYYYNSVANFYLRSLDAAEKSAREGMKLDPNHQLPGLEHVLGVILANKKDYPGAAQFMRSYLQHAPDSSNADAVRKQLAAIDKLLAQAPAQAQPAP